MTVRVRLAPSPTGNFHIGTARTALFNWLFAKTKGGSFLIRIEDTDKERSKDTYKENIFEGLKWLGLNWDKEPVIQSKRMNEHKSAIKFLLDKGFAYRCYLNEKEINSMREEQKRNGKPPKYDNRSRDLTPEQEKKFIQEGRDAVVRFRIDDNETINWKDLIRGNMSWKGSDLGGDMVISRRAPAEDIGDPLYNLVVVVDDAFMQITDVIRGEDHIANTAKQILLYQALGLNIPNFAHTPLILNEEGKKLSKRDGVTSISKFKEMGYTSSAMANYMALLGWSPPEGESERLGLKQLSKLFDLKRVNKAGAKFDWDKLNWLNSQVIQDTTDESLLDSMEILWEKNNWHLPNKEWGIKLIELIKPSICILSDGINLARPFFEQPSLDESANDQLTVEGSLIALKFILKQLEKSQWDGIDKEKAKELITNTINSTNIKKGIIMKSLRAALLGSMKGPDLMTSWALLARKGEDKIRLNRCLSGRNL